ncbi:DNA-directed RNA polymerase IV subunit 1 isoform X2 [Hevea brasiliensis]|uniref:DNA-directed RNA polymerase IV subunit 1 isoform X2 n=1 Tax=Hevea brasiliensis TaxID=3981 RepID=UPI0025E9C2CF|nr:DNA-directed RNA polymerase IV subunit 1 isoform X2 [Hevea brasiliensis]
METDLSEEQQLPSALLTAITFGVSTETEKEKLSVLAIDAVSQVNDPKLGLPNPSSQCSTCGSKDLKSCEGHFGVIKFPFTILHPYYLSEVVQILNKVCPGCKSIRKETKANSIGWYPTMRFSVSSEEIFRKNVIIAKIVERPPQKSQKKGLKKRLAADYWDIIPKDEQEEENIVRPNQRVLSHAQVRHLLKDVDANFIRKFVKRTDSIFLNCFSVTPNCHRVTEVMHAFSSGQRLSFDERTRAYKKLVDFRGIAKELSFRVLDCLKTSKINPDNSVNNDDVIAMQRKINDSASNPSGLRWIKDVVLGKRNDNSFRMVVVGDPNIKLSEVGIPCHIAERLQISEHLTAWNWEKLNTCCEIRILEKGDMHVRREGNLVRIRRTKELRTGDIIYRPLNDGDIVLINRPPSIHQHSLIALSVKVLPVTSVLAINPLCCSPFRGDFDGDCLHGYVPQSVDTRVELSELVALDKQLTNAQSGRNLLSLSQDSLVAAHLVMEDGVFISLFQMQQLQMFCPHQLSPAIIKAPLLNGCVWTGKQLISMLLPRGLDHDFPSNNVCIRDGELISSEGSFWLRDTDGNLFQSLVKHCQSQVLDFLHTAQEVLCEWLSMRGLSVSLSDLYLCPDSNSWNNMMSEVFCGIQDAVHTCNVKQFMVDSCQDFLAGNGEDDQYAMDFDVERLCYDKQRSAALSQASVDAFKHVFRDIQSLAYKYASKDNALMAMFKAGSKGNLLKLVQHSMCLGLQHSLVPLPFRMPHQLSCVAWNKQKDDNATECAKCYIPSAVVEGSFLTGLNPLECFVHSVTSRDSSFSDNADLPGTLTRRLMFFMRDIHAAYDGTVRNAYGNQLVQFSYNNDTDMSAPSFSPGHIFDNCDGIGGQPVGSLAACAISEAAYSALDQPISLLEKSPLLNLKNVLECGLKKSNAHKSVSLFLSEKLGRQRHGFEYAALEVQDYLERILFSDIVSISRIMFSPQSEKNEIKTRFSPWVCHFHVHKEIMKKRRLKVQSIIDTLYNRCNSENNLPNVQITCKDCSVADNQREKEDMLCITVTIIEKSRNSSVQLDTIQDLMIPFLLETVLKGLMEIEKVDILWNDRPRIPKLHKNPYGELYLRVSMSGSSDKTRLWNLLVDYCLPIMDMIDWTRSHPDNIRDFCLAYGIDAGWKFFLNNLASAISDVGKSVLPEHLLLVANCLSVTGEFVGLNAKGWKRQREHASVLSPFVQACFSNPGNCFIKAAKAEIVDDLRGSLDALSWGKIPSIGTGQFDIVFSGKEYKLSKPVDVYDLLGSQMSTDEQNNEFEVPFAQSYKSDKYSAQFVYKTPYDPKRTLESLRRLFTYNDIHRLSQALSKILNKYPVDHQLNETDKCTLMMALHFHPRRDEKIGSGAKDIKVVNHPEYQDSRCFSLVRTDGTNEDFSYRKCVHGALEIIAPQKARRYQEKYLQSRNL